MSLRLPPLPSQERAFLQSVLYASLFDYPLTLEQLREGLIGETAEESQLLAWYERSDLLRAALEYDDGCFFPRGRHDLLVTRQRREVISRRMLCDLEGPLRLVRSMPFVRMAALSGSLAHLNAEVEADLDLFVITSPSRVWSVTLTALLLARLFGWRRRLCLNYVISERDLRVSPADLFSANQIVHLRPLTGMAVYRRFLEANGFVSRFYPNFSLAPDRALERDPRGAASHRRPWHGGVAESSTRRRLVERVLDWTLAPVYERACRTLYGWHLRRRSHTWASREQVRLERECLKLHTSSHRKEIMERFDRAVLDALSGTRPPEGGQRQRCLGETEPHALA